MQVDAASILLFGLLVKFALAALFFLFWAKERRAIWFAWYGAALCFGGVSGVLMLRGFAPELLGVGLGAAAMIAAVGCAWQGARAFERRKPLWLPLIGAPALWIAVSLVPGFLETASYRVLLSSALAAPILAMGAVEFWRGREEKLPSRWMLIVLMGSLAILFLARIALIRVAPFPIGALPPEPAWVAAFNVIVFFHTMIIAVLAVAITKERLELQQRTRAQTDSLTGAMNRRAFMTRGRRLILRHQRSAEPLCLLFLDLDRFKSLNDRFGHAGGDEVLMRFVSAVHENIRPGDFLFRIGGEEFCCLLPGTEIEQAVSVAQRVRQEFAAYPIILNGTPVKPTVSIGLAATETFGYDPDELLRHADRAAYEAKEQGRNRVIVATSPATVTMAAE